MKPPEIGVGHVATVMGRLYAMDRDNAWARVKKPTPPWYTARASKLDDPVKAIEDSYQVIDETGKHLTDELCCPRSSIRRRHQGE